MEPITRTEFYKIKKMANKLPTNMISEEVGRSVVTIRKLKRMRTYQDWKNYKDAKNQEARNKRSMKNITKAPKYEAKVTLPPVNYTATLNETMLNLVEAVNKLEQTIAKKRRWF